VSNLALVLAGGGGKGAYQIGVWKALKEFGVEQNIEAVSGTSVGALNAIAFVQGNYEIAEQIWLNLSHEQILSIRKSDLVKASLSNRSYQIKMSLFKTLLNGNYINGIFARDGLLKILEKYIHLPTVASSPTKCFITCCELPLLRAAYFDLQGKTEEQIKLILLASSALPWIYDDVEIDGHNFIDGGIVDNVPITPLYNKGFRNFLVVHLGRDSLIETEKFPGARIIELVPKENQGTFIDGTLDFDPTNARRRIQQGYEDTKRILQPLYEMGMIQKKILNTLSNMKEDNREFQEQRNELLNERYNLKLELGELLNGRGNNNVIKSTIK
jgi:NTE family protein